MTRDEDLFRVVMRNDLASFAQRAIAEIMPGLALEWNWHLDLIADRLTRLADGNISRLLICVPPRSLKSLLCSVIYPAWLMARNDAERLLCISYAQPLAEDFARQCRQLMGSHFYCSTFDTRLSPDRRAVEQFETTGGGGRITSSVHGTVTGRGGDFVILDDIMKPEEALSEAGRKSVLDWLRDTLVSRPNSKRDQRLLVIMQRLHEDDVAGYLMAQGGWESLVLPAIAAQAEEHHFEVAGRPVTVRRAPGEALHPQRESLETLEQLRRDMGNLTFAAQYQQNPLPVDGNFVKRDWFKAYQATDLLGIERVIQSVDTGSKTASTHDFSVCTTWGLKAGNIFLLDVWRGKLEMPELCRKVIELSDRFNPERVLIEDKGSGTALMHRPCALNTSIRQQHTCPRETSLFGLVGSHPLSKEGMYICPKTHRGWTTTCMNSAGSPGPSTMTRLIRPRRPFTGSGNRVLRVEYLSISAGSLKRSARAKMTELFSFGLLLALATPVCAMARYFRLGLIGRFG